MRGMREMAVSWRRVLVISCALVLIGVAINERLNRQIMERRYEVTRDRWRRLEVVFEKFLVKYHRANDLAAREQQRTLELTERLSQRDAALNDVRDQLVQETQTSRELKDHLGVMEHQINQLQGELALVIQRVIPEETEHAGPIELERVYISTGSEYAGPRGHVVSIDEAWSFIVVNLGWDTVKIGDLVSIFRREQLLAKARIERVQEEVAAATILPEWDGIEVQINDVVRVL